MVTTGHRKEHFYLQESTEWYAASVHCPPPPRSLSLVRVQKRISTVGPGYLLATQKPAVGSPRQKTITEVGDHGAKVARRLETR